MYMLYLTFEHRLRLKSTCTVEHSEFSSLPNVIGSIAPDWATWLGVKRLVSGGHSILTKAGGGGGGGGVPNMNNEL